MRKKQDRRLSQTLQGQHSRRLVDTTAARRADADREHTTESDILCRRLLEYADTPREPNALHTRLDNLFVDLGLKPSIKAGLFGDTSEELPVSGDGTTMESAASSRGKRTCDCPPNSNECDHPRLSKRPNGTGEWIFHACECPKHADCRPETQLGYTQYIACRNNPRFFPEIPRDSKRFKELYAMRTGVERSNSTEDAYHLDRCTRHAVYGLIRLFFVDCAKHAKVRWLEQRNNASAKQLLQAALTKLRERTETVTQPQ
jgi:hypothetical protein